MLLLFLFMSLLWPYTYCYLSHLVVVKNVAVVVVVDDDGNVIVVALLIVADPFIFTCGQ